NGSRAPATRAGSGNRAACSSELSRDDVRIEHAATPSPAARVLQCGPQAARGGQRGIGRQVVAQRARRQYARTFFRASIDDEVYRALQFDPVNDDLDLVAFLDLAQRSACQSFRRDVADAGAGGNAAEARV